MYSGNLSGMEGEGKEGQRREGDREGSREGGKRRRYKGSCKALMYLLSPPAT